MISMERKDYLKKKKTKNYFEKKDEEKMVPFLKNF